MDHWAEQAACARPSADPGWWDCSDKSRALTSDNRLAIRICLTCPVRGACQAATDADLISAHGTIRAGRPILLPWKDRK